MHLQANDTQVEVFDKWWDPSSSIVKTAGGSKETRSDRLALWTSQQTGSVSKIRNELRATRMEAFQADEESKQALARAQSAQEALMTQKQVQPLPSLCTSSIVTAASLALTVTLSIALSRKFTARVMPDDRSDIQTFQIVAVRRHHNGEMSCFFRTMAQSDVT